MANYLKIYLETHPFEIINSSLQKLESAFELLLTDRTSETRRNAREAFKIFQKTWPVQADKIYTHLPANVMSTLSSSKNSSGLIKISEDLSTRHHTIRVKKAIINISGEDNFYDEFMHSRSPHINQIKQSIEKKQNKTSLKHDSNKAIGLNNKAHRIS